eukprot:gene16296-19381_t
MNKFICLLSTVLLLAVVANARVFEGSVKGHANWYLIGNVAVANNATVNINADFSWSSPRTQVLLYSDLESSWGRLLNARTCQQKVDAASYRINRDSSALDIDIAVTQMRTRYWYFAIANCQEKVNIPSYEITVSQPGDLINSVVAADEKDIPHVTIAFIVLFSIMLIFATANYCYQSKLDLNAGASSLFILVLVLRLVGLVIDLAYWSVYISKDNSSQVILLIGNVAHICSLMTFVCLVLKISQGWTFTNDHASLGLQCFTYFIVLAFLGTSIGSLVLNYQDAEADKASHYNFYLNTNFGYALTAIFCTFAIMFVGFCIRSYIRDTEAVKKSFFAKFGMCFAFWFACYPCQVIISHFVAVYSANQAVTFFTFATDFIFYAAFLAFFRGTQGNTLVHALNPTYQPKGLKLNDNQQPQPTSSWA